MKGAKEDDGDEATTGRGRGRGKGRGRGRGRAGPTKRDAGGKLKAEENEEVHDAKPKANKNKSEAKAAAKKASKKALDQSKGWGGWSWGEWEEWGAGDGWDVGDWCDEYGYQTKEDAWDMAAWQEGQASLHELEEDSATSKKKAKTQPKNHDKTPAAVKGKAAKPGTEHAEVDEKKKKPRKTVDKSGGSSPAGRAPSKRVAQREPTEETNKKPRRKKQSTEPQQGRAASGNNDDLEESSVLPPTKEERVNEILSFMKGFAKMSDDDAKILMRGRLLPFRACRQNVYWTRSTCGLHHYSEKKDFGHMSCTIKECPGKYKKAAVMKGSEMLVTCQRLIENHKTVWHFWHPWNFRDIFMSY